MSNKKVVILNGAGNGDDYLTSPFSVLTDLLEDDNADIRCYNLKDLKLAHCKGCMDCWIKTPGICMIADEGREIIQTIMQSDMIILFSPVTFGGYSSTLKIIVDRFIPLILPFLAKYYRETHHKPRYSYYPRLVGIGIQRYSSKPEVELFKTLVGRTAIDFHASSFAADVFSSEEDNEKLKEQLQNTISRSDSLPVKNIISFFPKADIKSFYNKQENARNAMLIVGSPKIKKRSTSDVFGEYLLEIMKSAGWKTEKLMLKGSLKQEKGQTELCSAVDRSDLIILVFPLYINTLPYLVTKALEVIASHKKVEQMKRPQRIFTFVNNGFPEFYQNALALAICRNFADQCGIFWAGALAMGAGEVLGQGQELTLPKRSGPPVKHVIKALDKAGEALVKESAIPSNIQNLISKPPIPLISFRIWRWIMFAGQSWKQQALKNGVSEEKIYAKPYAD
ncbi:MAG: flavodoxin family protein [Bacteroidales bacterium]|nr:flavodoxin family protein [Bacteroidales bacterium]